MLRSIRLAFLFACFLCLSAYGTTIPNPAKKKEAGPLFQIKRGEKWGYMDRTGKTVIAPAFDATRDFFNGLAGVLIKDKWGYINEKGAIVISPEYDDVRDFVDDLAPVRIGRKWGYADKSGRLAIAPRFQGAAEFREGLARVHVWDRVVCTSEEFTKEDAPSWAFTLMEDDRSDLRSCFPQGGLFGFVDRTGAYVIEPRFFVAQDFAEGLAAVRVEETTTSKFGYINRSGNFIISPRFNQAGAFSEGLAAVETRARIVGNQVVDIAWGSRTNRVRW